MPVSAFYTLLAACKWRQGYQYNGMFMSMEGQVGDLSILFALVLYLLGHAYLGPLHTHLHTCDLLPRSYVDRNGIRKGVFLPWKSIKTRNAYERIHTVSVLLVRAVLASFFLITFLHLYLFASIKARAVQRRTQDCLPRQTMEYARSNNTLR